MLSLATYRLAVGESARHRHETNEDAAGLFEGWGNKSQDGWVTAAKQNNNGGAYRTAYAGGNQYHNNLSPAIAAYVWQRTA